jgi:hypothetical protein
MWLTSHLGTDSTNRVRQLLGTEIVQITYHADSKRILVLGCLNPLLRHLS